MMIKAHAKTAATGGQPGRQAKLSAALRGLCRWTAIAPGDRVLHIGCGNGDVLALLSRQTGFEACGVTESMQEVRLARGRLQNADILYSPCDDIPWRANSFHTVLCALPLHQIKDPARMLTEVLRVLRPGGQFVLSIPWYPAPIRQLANCLIPPEDCLTSQSVVPSRQETIAALRNAGFADILWRQVDMAAGVTIGWKAKAHSDSMEIA